jgi:hypothetical protein
MVDALDRILKTEDPAASLNFLIEEFRSSKNCPLFFEARLMKMRLELGLPLIQTEATSSFPPEKRALYDQGMMEAARETGELALAAGNIERAWPYFRAIGEPSKIAEAIEKVEPGDDLEGIIGIAFQEGVHPAKGLELILKQHGMCRAITSFGMYAIQNGRDQCIALLTRGLHSELLANIGRAIESREGSRPQTSSLIEATEGRDWLFGEYDYYVDTSHLVSILPYALEVNDPEVLKLSHEMCEYGKRLSPMFQQRGQPPFEDVFVDYDEYIQALLGVEVDARVEHFRKKAAEGEPDAFGFAAAELLVNLLVRLGRYEEALEASLQYLPSDIASNAACPSPLQLCHLARDYERLRQLARERGDLLSYVAASVLQTENAQRS